MAMARICDVCGKPVGGTFRQLKVIVGDESKESRNWKTVKLLDMHQRCFSGFAEWLHKTREQSDMFKATVNDGVPAHGGPVK